MAYVYRHIRLDTNVPFYIGIGSDENYKRSRNRVNRNEFWKKIVSKTKYKIEIIIDNLTYEEVLEKEKEFIKLYGRYNLKKGTLCNLTDGGDGTLGRKVIVSEETRLKMSLSHMGMAAPNKGIPHSEEHKRKLREKKVGVVFSEEHKKNMSKALMNNQRWLGKKHKEDSRLKISNSIKAWHKKRKELKNEKDNIY